MTRAEERETRRYAVPVEQDGRTEGGREHGEEALDTQALEAPLDEYFVRQLSTRELSGELIAHLGMLVREQVQLAKAELTRDVKEAKRAGILLGVAGVLTLIVLALLAVALAQVLAAVLPAPIASLIVAGALLLIALPLALIGYRKLPKQPLAQTRQEIQEEIQWTRTQLA